MTRITPLVLAGTVAVGLLVGPSLPRGQAATPAPATPVAARPTPVNEPGPRGPRGPEDGSRAPRANPEERTTQLLDVIRGIDPEWAESLQKQRESDPKKFEQTLSRGFMLRYQELVRLKTEDPTLYEMKVKDFKLTRRSMALAMELRRARAATQPAKEPKEPKREGPREFGPFGPPPSATQPARSGEQVTAELRQVVTEQFAVRQQISEHELDRLQKRIEEVRKQLGDRAKNRDSVIEARLKALTGEHPMFQW